tara:strand:+ start:1051 stop:1194 length:144 start_codon:yes stop_codon:yes gene_type:complete
MFSEFQMANEVREFADKKRGGSTAEKKGVVNFANDLPEGEDIVMFCA